MTTWDEQKIRFFMDAAEHVRFNDALAARAARHLPQNAHVCDAGCGLGYLSLALMPYCSWVTAMDCAAEALAVLEKNCADRSDLRLSLRQGDVFAMERAARFDAMVFCFFGGVEETLRCVKAHCDGPAILFKKDWSARRFTLDRTPVKKITLPMSAAALDALNVPYKAESFPLDMGQPFRSLSDAVTFFRLYGKDPSAKAVSEDAVLQLLTRQDSPAFPYYLPAVHSVGMIVVEAGQIPDTIFQA